MSGTLFTVAALACLTVLAVLLAGFATFAKGGEFNRRWSNKLMQALVALQFVAVVLIVALAWVMRGQGELSMVVLNRIYTRTGDAGETALGDGSRVAKHSLRVSAYGTVDEANATIGLARLHAAGETDAALARIQNDLFDLGADLCLPDRNRDAELPYAPLRMVPSQTSRLESEIDAMNARLEPLRSFILPGGSALAAHLHLCRTVTRRAERLVVELAGAEPVNPSAITFLNRLSDWFFVAGRIANDDGRADVLWTPGANR